MPTAIKFTTRDEPPNDMKGSGTPVKGIRDDIAAKLTADWTANQTTMPPAISFPKLSGAFSAILNPRQAKNPNNIMTTVQPKNPNSSPTIAKIESVVASGI